MHNKFSANSPAYNGAAGYARKSWTNAWSPLRGSASAFDESLKGAHARSLQSSMPFGEEALREASSGAGGDHLYNFHKDLTKDGTLRLDEALQSRFGKDAKSPFDTKILSQMEHYNDLHAKNFGQFEKPGAAGRALSFLTAADHAGTAGRLGVAGVRAGGALAVGALAMSAFGAARDALFD